VHYDYWEDALRRSILADSHADLLIYGMGERQIQEIANQLESGIPIAQIRQVPGTCFIVESQEEVWDAVKLPSWEECRQDPKAFAKAGGLQFLEQDPIRGKTLLQEQERGFLVQNPPAMPLTMAELDAVYDLPYMRTWHPYYDQAGGVPAIEKFSSAWLVSAAVLEAALFEPLLRIKDVSFKAGAMNRFYKKRVF